MRSFQAICVALAVASGQGQVLSRTLSYGSGLSYGTGLSYGSGLSYGTGLSYAAAPAVATYAAPAVSRSIAVHHAAPAVSVAHVAAPIATRTVSVAAAPAVAVHHAPAAVVHHATPAAHAVNVGVIATAPGGGIRSHEIHTGSGRQAIRIEDFQAGDQVIRVHEGPQAAPEVAQVAVPGEQHHVRVINHQSGPAHIERVVHRQPTQVVDLQRPGRPGARIVQVVRGQAPAPSIEFVNAGGSDHHVYHADDATVAAPAAVAVHHAPAVAVHHAPAAVAVHSAPAAVVHHAAPVVSRTISVQQAAPAVAVHHAPAVAVHHAPATTYAVQHAPATTYAVQHTPAVAVHHDVHHDAHDVIVHKA